MIEEKILVNELAKRDNAAGDFCCQSSQMGRCHPKNLLRRRCGRDHFDSSIGSYCKCISQSFDDKLKAISMCISRFDTETKESFLDLYSKVDAGVSVEDIMAEKNANDEIEDDDDEENKEEEYSL